MSHYRNIFLIADASMQRTPALDQAAALAQRSGATLHLRLFDYVPALAVVKLLDREAAQQAREGYLQTRRDWLEAEAKLLRERGIEVTADVVWGNPVHEEMLKQIDALAPDIVVKDVCHEPLLRRLLLTPMDWRLLRLCPFPLLLVNGHARGAPGRVVAAVDTARDASGIDAFNARIIRVAASLAAQCDAALHVVHAASEVSVLDPSIGGALAALPQDTYETLLDHERSGFTRFTEAQGVPAERSHLLTGSVHEAFAGFADAGGCDVFVMGSVHRTGVDRMLLGSTAERVIQHLPCSVLAIKPAGFPGAPDL